MTRGRASARVALGGAAIVVLASLALARGALGPRAQSEAAPAAPAAYATALTDLPLPVTDRKDALDAYVGAIQALRDGAQRTATRELRRALSLDPTMAAAHLRLCTYAFWVSPTETREHFRRASQRRSTLSEHDQILLDAFDPAVRSEPPDRKETTTRLRTALERFPLDAEFALLAATIGSGFMATKEADLANYDRAIAIDPKFGLAYAYKAQSQAYWADAADAQRTTATCLAQSPAATMCANFADELLAFAGRCAELETGARHVMAMDPESDLGYRPLANAAYASGQPLEAVKKTLELGWARTRVEDRAATTLGDTFALAVLRGDFAGAEKAARDLDGLVAAQSTAAAHAGPAAMLVALYQEMGRDAAAADAAESYLRSRAAWVPDPRGEDFAVARDPVPVMLAAELRARRISREDFTARRDAWVAAWRTALMPRFVPFAWLHGYAAVAQTREDAATALAALPNFLPIPRHAPRTLSDAAVGRVYLLAERPADGIPFLGAATKSCFAVDQSLAHTQAHVSLGMALEQTGDVAGACDAYGVVLARWGHAKPRSVSAERARERSLALGCPRVSGR